MLVFDSSAFKANYDSGDDFHARASELMHKIAMRQTDVITFVTTRKFLPKFCSGSVRAGGK